MDYSTAEFVAFFDKTELAAQLVGTRIATEWASTIVFGWMVQSSKKDAGALGAKIKESVRRTYIEMAKLKAAVKTLTSPNLGAVVNAAAVFQIWLSPDIAPDSRWKDYSYTASAVFKNSLDALIEQLRKIRSIHDPDGAIQDYRNGTIEYRPVESAVDCHFPGAQQTYVLREGVPLELRDSIDHYRNLLLIRLLGVPDPGDEIRFQKEAYLLHDQATQFGDDRLPNVPSVPPLSISQFYDYASTLLAWTERGGFMTANRQPEDTNESHRVNAVPKAGVPAVTLSPASRSAVVRGSNKPLNIAQYDVIESLVNARPNGLTKDGIERVRTDARGILRRLLKDNDWASVIHMAGVTSGRYRID